MLCDETKCSYSKMQQPIVDGRAGATECDFEDVTQDDMQKRKKVVDMLKGWSINATGGPKGTIVSTRSLALNRELDLFRGWSILSNE